VLAELDRLTIGGEKSPAEEARLLNLRGSALCRLDRWDEGLSHLTRAVKIADDSNDRLLPACQASAGAAYVKLRKFALAQDSLAAALEGARAQRAVSLEAKVRLNLAMLALYQQNAESASVHAEQAVEAFRQLDDRASLAVALRDLAVISIRQGEPSTAIVLLDEVLGIDEARGDHRGKGRALQLLGEACVLNGEIEQARRHLADALRIHRSISGGRNQAFALGTLGVVESLRRRFPEAERRLVGAMRLQEEAKHQAGVDIARLLLAAHYIDADQPNRARGELIVARASIGVRGEQAVKVAAEYLAARIADPGMSSDGPALAAVFARIAMPHAD